MLLTLILVLAIALAVSFACSLLEACVLSVGNADLAAIEQRSPGVGRIWRSFKTDLQRPLAVILILNTCAHTIGAAYGGAYFEALCGEKWLVAFSIAVSFAMIQWTEILPKTLGAQFNRQLAPLVAAPLHWLIRVLQPVVWLVHFLNRPFEPRTRTGAPSTAEEIRALARSALLSKQMGPQQVRIISAGTELAGRTARQIMVPPDEISYLDADMSLPAAFAKAHLDAHTRYPLCENNDLDRPIGYVNFKELVSILNTNPRDATLRGIARPLLFVDPEEPCSSVLRSLVDGRWHIAIVRGAGSTTLGLLTMEDVVEELIGDVEDEFDRLPRTIHRLGESTFAVGGGYPMKELAQRLGIEGPQAAAPVSEWISGRLGRSPQPNESLWAGPWRLTVRRIRRRRAYEVLVVRDDQGKPPPPD